MGRPARTSLIFVAHVLGPEEAFRDRNEAVAAFGHVGLTRIDDDSRPEHRLAVDLVRVLGV